MGVVLLGAPGAGKSDLLLRLLNMGFALVADDRLEIEHGIARAPQALAGLLEVRGLGILRLPYVSEARLALAVELSADPSAEDRLPEPRRHPMLDLPLVTIDPRAASAAARVGLALDCALGRVSQVAGALA
jgi:HPr kinase/phosphorylase